MAAANITKAVTARGVTFDRFCTISNFAHLSRRIPLPSKICKTLNGKVDKHKKGGLISERVFFASNLKKRVPNYYLPFLECSD